MKKTFFFFLALAAVLSFTACEQEKSVLSGKEFVDRIDAANYVSYYFGETTCIHFYVLPSIYRTFDYYYKMVDNTIYMYRDKKHTKPHGTAQYYGSYILVNEDGEMTKYVLE